LGTANYVKGLPAKVWLISGEQGVAEAGMPDVNLAYQDFQQMPNGRFEKEYGMTKQDWKAQYARVLNPPKPFAAWDDDDLKTAEIEKPSARTRTAQQWGVKPVPRGVPTMGSQQASSGMYVFHSKSVARGGGSFTDQQLASFGLSKTRNGNWVYRPQTRMSPDDIQRKVRELTSRLNAKPYYYDPNNKFEETGQQYNHGEDIKIKDLSETWSNKYKKSINCSHPKGFSQKAHCAGKKKHSESIEMEHVCPDCGMCKTHGTISEIKKGAKDSNGYTSCWKGYHAAGTKKSNTTGKQVRNCVKNEDIEEIMAGLISIIESKHGRT
jgi:hypothetical protein